MTPKSTHRLFMTVVGLSLLLGLTIWMQASVSPAAAQGEGPVDLAVQISSDDADFGASAIESAPVFYVGDQFTISIVAQGVTDPGIFGSQFDVLFDPVHLQAVDGSLVSGTEMEPVVIALANIQNDTGTVSWAASRQGDVDNLVGDVVLASLTFEAIAPTEPPEGQTTAIDLDNVKLGAKGGIDVPVSGLVGAEVIIRDLGDIAGNVTVEGRASDQQAGHTVQATNSLAELFETMTDSVGDFLFDGMLPDTYTLLANSAGFLSATCEGVTHGADLTTLEAVTLLAGDIDGDDAIDITDAVAIGTAFGSTAGGDVADLNLDGVVDILDLILMAANYGQTSAENPWVCQLATEI